MRAVPTARRESGNRAECGPISAHAHRIARLRGTRSTASGGPACVAGRRELAGLDARNDAGRGATGVDAVASNARGPLIVDGSGARLLGPRGHLRPGDANDPRP